MLPGAWNIVFVVNSFDWADWLAGAAIHALIRLDVEHATAFVDAIYWALLDARLVLNVYTRFCNYVGHLIPFLCCAWLAKVGWAEAMGRQYWM